MHELQIWLVTTIGRGGAIADLMQKAWTWPIIESLHFLGLCLLVGAVGAFDLRLLGVAKRVPIAAVHRLIPWGLAGFALNIATGLMFVLTEPDQYIYNPAFHLKLTVIVIAGLNAGLFYLTSYRRAFGPGATLDAPPWARMIAVISLSAWVTVIVCGRMITFYRPAPCRAEQASVLLTCVPQ